jgi:outer membrane protein OmpA-like peptidoglycan-associated protein
MTAAALLCAAMSVSYARADDVVVVGQADPPAVEVNLGVLESLSADSAGTYPSIEPSAVQSGGNSGSVLLIEPAEGFAPSIVAPAAETDTFVMPSAVPPLPEPAPEPVVVETVETVDVVAEEPVDEEPVAEEIAAVEEPAATADMSDAAALDIVPEGEDDPFNDIQQMLDNAEAANAIEVPQPETTVEEAIVATASQTSEAVAVESLQLVFQAGVETLSDRDKSELDVLAGDLVTDEDQRVQLMAYASSQDGTASMARRLALSRALEVRKYLIDSGVRSTRIDVRALGNVAESGPLDRIDIVLVER